jgi:hypothetical protein
MAKIDRYTAPRQQTISSNVDGAIGEPIPDASER